MKKQISLVLLFVTLGFFLSKSQALSLFTPFPFPQAQCNNLAGNYSNQWKPSHGSPNVLNVGCGNNVVRLYSKNQSITERKSEGIFIDLNNIGITLTPQKKYKIIITYRYSFPNNPYNAINFDAYFANDMVEKSNNNCEEEKEPTVSDKIKILSFATGESLSDTYPCQVKSVEKGQIVIGKSYKYLWITSNLNNSTPGLREYVDIDKVELYLDGDNGSTGGTSGGTVEIVASDLKVPCSSTAPITFKAVTSSTPLNNGYSWEFEKGWSKNGAPVSSSSGISDFVTVTPTDPTVLPGYVKLVLRMNGQLFVRGVYVKRKEIDEANILKIIEGIRSTSVYPATIDYSINLENQQSVYWSSSDTSVADVAVSIMNPAKVILKKPGQFALSVKVFDFCGQSKTFSIGVDTENLPLGPNGNIFARKNETKMYKVFPNPASDVVNIKLVGSGLQDDIEKNYRAELFNALGVKVKEIALKKDIELMSVTGLIQGVYTLKIYTNSKVEEHQLIVK